MGIRSKNRVLNNFSMSGMTDIVFLLLIFFMLTSTLIAPNALKLLLPSRGQTNIQVENKVPTVTIHSNASITVDGVNILFDNLDAVLESKLAGQTEPAIKIVTSPQVSVGDAVKVMNVAADRNYTVILKQL